MLRVGLEARAQSAGAWVKECFHSGACLVCRLSAWVPAAVNTSIHCACGPGLHTCVAKRADLGVLFPLRTNEKSTASLCRACPSTRAWCVHGCVPACFTVAMLLRPQSSLRASLAPYSFVGGGESRLPGWHHARDSWSAHSRACIAHKRCLVPMRLPFSAPCVRFGAAASPERRCVAFAAGTICAVGAAFVSWLRPRCLLGPRAT
jgi:hypothetical protein